jgi:RNA polymerase sigma factor (TIGR02999 family)
MLRIARGARMIPVTLFRDDLLNSMTEESTNDVSQLLQQWVGGDQQALTELMPMVYDELRRMAHRQLQAERSDHTLQSTALVNEAFIRFLGQQPSQLQNKNHFIAVAARLMRQILVDHARARQAGKRDGGHRIDVEALENLAIKDDAQLLALDDALTSLAQIDERQARIVDMKFFGGLTAPAISEVLGVSLTTVERDWAFARLWLRKQMKAGRTVS